MDILKKLDNMWQTQNLKEKLCWLVVFHTIAFTSLLVILNGGFHLSTTVNGDISGWYSLIIGSTIGIYITFAILIYSDTSQKKTEDIIKQQDEFRKKHREVAMDIIGKNLLAQTSVLASLQRKHGKNNIGVNAFTGEKIDMIEHDERGLQLNNMELKMILASSAGILHPELLKKLLHFSSQFDFLEKFKPYIAERGEWMHLRFIKQIIEQYFPELLKEFEGFGGSTTETHDYKKSDKS